MSNGHGTSESFSKPPVDNTHQSPNHSSRNGVPIQRIILHYTAGGEAEGAISTFMQANPSDGNPRSAHYIVDKNGDIYQLVRDSDKAWHCKGANQSSIGIEHVARQHEKLTTEQEAASIALIKWLLAEYKLPPSAITGHRFAAANPNATDCPSALFGDETKQALEEWIKNNFVNTNTLIPVKVNGSPVATAEGYLTPDSHTFAWVRPVITAMGASLTAYTDTSVTLTYKNHTYTLNAIFQSNKGYIRLADLRQLADVGVEWLGTAQGINIVTQ